MVWIQSTASKDADEVLGDFMDKVEQNDPLFNWTRRNDKGIIAATTKKVRKKMKKHIERIGKQQNTMTMAGICYRFDRRNCYDYDKGKLKDAKARMRRLQKIPMGR
eukprot:5471312-Karenia_brevis.AAC.1